jgi:hypothetical protein
MKLEGAFYFSGLYHAKMFEFQVLKKNAYALLTENNVSIEVENIDDAKISSDVYVAGILVEKLDMTRGQFSRYIEEKFGAYILEKFIPAECDEYTGRFHVIEENFERR